MSLKSAILVGYMAHTQTSTQKSGLDSGLAALIPKASEVYDAIMGPIEPELTSENLALLTEKYGHEPAEEQARRLERYRKAFAVYDKAYEKWAAGVHNAALDKRRSALKKAEQQLQQKDQGLLAKIDSIFTDS